MQECTRLLSCVMEAKTTLERVYRRWVTAVNCFCIPSRVMCWSSVIYYFSYMLVFVHFSYMLVLVHFGHSVFFFMYRLSTMSTQSSALLWSARFVVFFFSQAITWLSNFLALFAVCNACYYILQDPSEQTAIDNYMVQQLDGTVNEWGWCKQKVK